MGEGAAARPSVQVGAAGPDDAVDLARLRFQWQAGERGEQGLDERSFLDVFVAWMQDHAATHTPFLARRGGRPVGMIWLALVDRVPGPGRVVRRSAYIQSTYVVPSERSHGVGSCLVEALLAHARELGLDYVAVHPSQRAFPLYRRLGFAETDRVLELRPPS